MNLRVGIIVAPSHMSDAAIGAEFPTSNHQFRRRRVVVLDKKTSETSLGVVQGRNGQDQKNRRDRDKSSAHVLFSGSRKNGNGLDFDLVRRVRQLLDLHQRVRGRISADVLRADGSNFRSSKL